MENEVVIEDSEKFDPGTARYGNFINYYSFNPAENRIRLLPNFMQFVTEPSNSRANIICLDVGCNTGELTQELHRRMTKEVDGSVKCQILGVDMDEILIERAEEMNQNELLSFKCVDVLAADFKTVCRDYLTLHHKKVFDVVFCFSITMWIHLNHGDEGLTQFIISLGEMAEMVVVEPQPWKCYSRAMRRMKRTNSEPFTQFDELKIRKEVECYIDSVLIKHCNFSRVLQSAPTKWGRQINFYKRKNS